MASKVDKIKEELAAVAEKLKEAKAEERKQLAKDDKARAEIIGRIYLKKSKTNIEFAGELKRELETTLTRDNERKLFGLEPKARP